MQTHHAQTVQRDPWPAVLALGITQITAWGSIYYLFPLVMEPLQAALGASKAIVVGAFSGALLVSGLLAPVVGRRIDRHGGRSLMAAASLLAALSLAALSRVTTVWQLYVVWGLLGVAMAGTLYEPAFAVITRAFSSHQRRAITVLTLFGGFASTVFWPLGQALIDLTGWRETTLIFGLLNLLVCLPLHRFALPAPTAQAAVRNDSAPSEPLPTVVRDRRFMLLAAAFTANALVFSAMAIHLLAMLGSKGISAGEAALLGAMVGPMQVAGRLADLGVGHHVSPSRIAMIALGLLPVSIAVFMISNASLWSMVLFAMLFGAGNGIMTIVRGAVPLELYGRAHYGAINGALAAPVLVAKALGPLAAALVWTMTQDYGTVAFALAAVAAFAVPLFGLAMTARLGPGREGERSRVSDKP
jgi:MFS family permease